MGWGTFIVGRSLSSARRDAQQSARHSRAKELELAEAEARWVQAVSQKTVLAHPKVRTQVDTKFWRREAERLFNWSRLWAVAADALLWVAAAVAFATADGDRLQAMTPWAMAGFFLFPVLMMVIPPLVRRRYLRRIDAGFAKAGWPVKELHAELRQGAAAALRQASNDRRAARQQTDQRLYPPAQRTQ